MDRPPPDAASDAAGPGPSSLNAAEAVRRKSILPKKWQRLQQQVEGKEYELPHSGAHVTLEDLIKETNRHLVESGAEDEIDTDIYAPWEEGKTVGGWLGTPDPTKFAPGTTRLSPEELQEEIKAGRVVAMDDWRQAIQELEPWERKLLHEMVVMDYMKNRVFVDVPGDNGEVLGKVSYLDLVQYVEHNPELKALVERQRDIGFDDPEVDAETQEALLPLRGAPGNPHIMALTEKQVKGLPWTCVGTGKIWGRRPTRWLKGLDGQLDYTFGVFVHEEHAHKLLGTTWSGRPSKDVLSSEQYWQDILAAGPQMGMTFVLAAARDVPVQEAGRLGQQLSKRMATRGLSEGDASSAMAALSALTAPNKLMQESRLFNNLGTHIRAGSTLMLTTLPDNKLLVQAMSADPVRTREYYTLGAIHNCTGLNASLTSLALGGGPSQPQEPPLDESVVSEVGGRLLLTANGYRAGDPAASGPNISIDGRYTPLVTRVARPRLESFKLPRVGQAVRQPPPTVLSGIQEALSLSHTLDQLKAVFLYAALAADEASSRMAEGSAEAEVLAARTRAAQQALAEGLQGLGLGLDLTVGAQDNLLNGAVPLQAK